MRSLKLDRPRWQAVTRNAALALGLLAAACAAPGRRAPLPAPPPVEARPEPARPQPLPQAAEQNRVALLVPLTGANAAVGQSIANAANMALLEAGERRINLRVYDTGQGAAAAASRAASEGAGLFLGPLLAPDVRAVQPIAAAKGIQIISFSNDASLAGGDTFVMGFQPGQSVARVVAFARARGVERFAAMVPAGVYGQRASTAFLRAVEAAGGRSVAVVSYTRDPARMIAAARQVTGYDARTKAATKSAALRPDGSVAPITTRMAPVAFQALLVADAGTVAAQLVPPLAQFGAAPGTIVMLGTELWNNEPALAGVKGLRGALFASVPDERFHQLAGRYRAKFGGNPSRLASFGYDSVLLVNSLAGSWKYGTAFPRGALGNPQGFAGIDGVFRFTSGGVAERGLEVQQIGSGAMTTVSAAPRTFGGN